MKKILIAGAGIMGSTHLAEYRQMNDVEVVGIVDKNKAKAKELGFKEEDIFSSIEAAAEKKDIDIIDICLPTTLHREAVEKAADYVETIICEKPLARTVADAKAMLSYCESKNVTLYVGHVVRFFKDYQQAKELLDRGKVGKVGMVHSSRVSPFPAASDNWYADFQISGGLILDLMIHDFDFLRWCFGEVKRVFAKSTVNRSHADKQYALVTLYFESGTIAHIEGSWVHEEFKTSFEFAGNKGIIKGDSSQAEPLTIEISNLSLEESKGASVPKSPLNNSPYFKELQHFIQCSETGKQAIVTAEDAVRALEISEAANRSLELNKPITL